ncbi:hypothetical protein NK8_83340 (plasmid) [Caballeronia sp. NK8]|nr:hypothetical protein NK8_83340 [Caballeronia sp. NK8]
MTPKGTQALYCMSPISCGYVHDRCSSKAAAGNNGGVFVLTYIPHTGAGK